MKNNAISPWSKVLNHDKTLHIHMTGLAQQRQSAESALQAALGQIRKDRRRTGRLVIYRRSCSAHCLFCPHPTLFFLDSSGKRQMLSRPNTTQLRSLGFWNTALPLMLPAQEMHAANRALLAQNEKNNHILIHSLELVASVHNTMKKNHFGLPKYQWLPPDAAAPFCPLPHVALWIATQEINHLLHAIQSQILQYHQQVFTKFGRAKQGVLGLYIHAAKNPLRPDTATWRLYLRGHDTTWFSTTRAQYHKKTPTGRLHYALPVRNTPRFVARSGNARHSLFLRRARIWMTEWRRFRNRYLQLLEQLHGAPFKSPHPPKAGDVAAY